MKKFKLLSVLTFLFILSFTLTSCKNKDKTAVQEAKEQLEIVFNDSDNKDSVTKDLKELKTSIGDVSITWSSSNTDVISNVGAVTRGQNDETVTLTATLKKGKTTATKEFTLKVLKLEVVVDYAGKLKEQYKDTIAKLTWSPDDNEEVELVSSIEGKSVQWISKSEYFVITNNKGKVTKPSYTAGDQTVVIEAKIESVEKKVTFTFTIKKNEATVDEMMDAAFIQLLGFTKDSDGYITGNFKTVATYTLLNGEDATITWESSNPSVMSNEGIITTPEDADKIVTMSATITYKGETKTKSSADIKIKKATSFVSFAEIFTSENLDKKVKVNNVSLYSYENMNGGFYIASSNNELAYIYGTKPDNVKAGKLYTVSGTVTTYYGMYQIKSATFVETGSKANTVTPKQELTIEQWHNLPKPSDNENFTNHTLYTLVNVKLIQAKVNGYDNYYFVNQDFDTTKEVNDQNSVRAYYKGNVTALNPIVGKNIEAINVVFNGYQSKDKAWDAMFAGTIEDDVKLSLTPEEQVSLAKDTLNAKFTNLIIYKQENIELLTTMDGVTITWTSDKNNITTEGVVTLPEEGNVKVKLTAVIKSTTNESLTETVEYNVVVGMPDLMTISEFIALGTGKVGLIEGVVSGLVSNGTYSIEDATDAVSLRPLSGSTFVIGNKYQVLVSKSEKNGLLQAEQKLESTDLGVSTLPAFVNLDSEELTSDNLLKYQSNLISLNRMEITSKESDKNNNIEMTFTRLTDGSTIDFRWDSRITIENNNLSELNIGDIIDVVGAPLGWYNAPQISFSNSSQIVKATLTDQDKVEQDAKSLTKTINISAAGSIDLPATGSNGTTITWAYTDNTNTNNSLINLTDKIVTMPEGENVTVNLTATVSLNEATKNVEVTVTLGEQVAEGTLMIYEVYGGGGNTGATYKNDYVVLYNGTNSTIDLSSYSLQYASKSGTFDTKNVNILTGTIEAGAFYVAQMAAGKNGTTDLPQINYTGTLALGGKEGKIALVKKTTVISNKNDADVVDFVGFGTANEYEGTNPVAILSNSTSARRKTVNGAIVDTNDNSQDFEVVTADLSYLK